MCSSCKRNVPAAVSDLIRTFSQLDEIAELRFYSVLFDFYCTQSTRYILLMGESVTPSTPEYFLSCSYCTYWRVLLYCSPAAVVRQRMLS